MIEDTLCPECNGPMIPRTSSHGKFWGCKDYPRCRGTRNAEGEARRNREQRDEFDLPSEQQRRNDRRRWENE